jgi:hypothetical protein
LGSAQRDVSSNISQTVVGPDPIEVSRIVLQQRNGGFDLICGDDSSDWSEHS